MTEQYTLHLADTLIVMTNAVEHGHSDLLSAICPTIWPIFCIILILFGLLLLFNNKCAKKFVTNHLSWIALFIWLSGFLLYAIGFSVIILIVLGLAAFINKIDEWKREREIEI